MDLTSGVTKARGPLVATAATVLVLAGCGTAGLSGMTPSATSSSTGSPSVGASTASPGATGSGTPTSTGTPTSSESPTGSGSPTSFGSPTSSGSPVSTPVPGATTPAESPSGVGSVPVPSGCTSVTPLRVEKVETGPRRTTEVVTLVSDGKNLTPGTGEQSEFGAPRLEAPDGSTEEDAGVLRKVAALVAAGGRNRVLLSRPESPDANADVSRRPLSTPGTYALYNASTPLTATVLVQCGTQEQRWSFTAESDLSRGRVSCAVEPPKSNALARLVFVNNCGG